jgi:hypothetical protein
VTLTDDGCRVLSGRWIDWYTGVVVTDASQLDVDHMVPLAEAHRSGGHTWTVAERTSYANDLGTDDALVAVTATANRSKGDSGPEAWLPPQTSAHCRYASAWVDVKYEYELSVSSDERTTLRQALASC